MVMDAGKGRHLTAEEREALHRFSALAAGVAGSMTRANGPPPLPDELRALLDRLPDETAAQRSGDRGAR